MQFILRNHTSISMKKCIFLCFHQLHYITGFFRNYVWVYWLLSRLVPKPTDSHCLHSKLESDTNFRHTVECSKSTKSQLLLFLGVGYGVLQCSWLARFPIFPSENARDSALGRWLCFRVLPKSFLLLHTARTEEIWVKISSEILCNSVGPDDLGVLWTLCLAMQVWVTESRLCAGIQTHPVWPTRDWVKNCPWVTGDFGLGQINIKHTGPFQDGDHFNFSSFIWSIFSYFIQVEQQHVFAQCVCHNKAPAENSDHFTTWLLSPQKIIKDIFQYRLLIA